MKFYFKKKSIRYRIAEKLGNLIGRMKSFFRKPGSGETDSGKEGGLPFVFLKFILKYRIFVIVFVFCLSALIAGLCIHGRTSGKKRKTEAASSSPKVNKTSDKVIDTADFFPCRIEYDSMKDDLTIYLNDNGGERISGISYSVKVMSPDVKSSLDPYLQALNIDKRAAGIASSDGSGVEAYSKSKYQSLIKAALETDDLDPSVSDDDRDPGLIDDDKNIKLVKRSGKSFTINDAISLRLKSDLDNYKKKLSSIDCPIYSDDDSDGIIKISPISPGDYYICLIPPSWDKSSKLPEADDYAISATVSSDLSFIPLVNIMDKVEEDVPDPEVNNVPLETALTDTVRFVPSATENVTNADGTVTAVYSGWQTIDGKTYYYDPDNHAPVTGNQVIGGAMYRFADDGSLVLNDMGIDVSHHQGDIDWNRVAGSVSFAIIRCGYRGTANGAIGKDNMFMKNMAGAKAAGIKTGIYFYSGAETQEEAVEEASLAVKMANDAGGVDLPIYIDWEGNERTNTVSPADATAIINAFAATVKNAGYKAGVYADRNHLTTSLYPSQFSEDISVWCAQYNTECTYSGRYDMWQYSSRGSIPGISGNVDLDRRN